MGPKCDFCTDHRDDNPVRWFYPTRNVQLNTYMPPTGGWMSCEPCRLLLEAGDVDALVQRSASMYMQYSPVYATAQAAATDRDELESLGHGVQAAIQQAISNFMDLRLGDARPI